MCIFGKLIWLGSIEFGTQIVESHHRYNYMPYLVVCKPKVYSYN